MSPDRGDKVSRSSHDTVVSICGAWGEFPSRSGWYSLWGVPSTAWVAPLREATHFAQDDREELEQLCQ